MEFHLKAVRPIYYLEDQFLPPIISKTVRLKKLKVMLVVEAELLFLKAIPN